MFITASKSCKKLVIGAGFIGVEMSDEFNKKSKDVTLIKVLPHIMGTAFDKEFADKAEENLKSRGVNVMTGTAVKGDGQVTGVLLDNGEELDADAVVLSCGYKPNAELAEKIGLQINEFGFIKVDQYMRTNVPDIFAVGDCAEKHDFSTGKLSKVMLASTACAEARVAAMNLFKLSTIKTFRGTIGIYSTCINQTSYAVAGLTETMARNENFDIVTGTFSGIDWHPGCLDDSSPQTVKLIVLRENGVVLGGEVCAGKSGGELINVIGFAIQNHMTIYDFLVAQIGTQPMLTASPAAYPLIKAAEMCARDMRK
ncbi:MAG: FAD-dependent oxidoreductase [candidate division KSB1 bacterium]|nr:FAD-dependent oxidoreductase [candidate division KSB1 bacterium]